jgi:predicted Rossmann fold nucleotide-binding protein DprA/Smf involved in DNA uptake
VATTRIDQGSSDYPAVLTDRLGENAPPSLYAMGEPSILRQRLLGLICSIQCPGSIVIKTLDAARALRDAGVAVIGGFHSPMERECLDILLRGDQPVILCPARGLAGLRLGQMPRRAVKEGRLLILSPFAENIRRTTAAQAVQRNNLVAALSQTVLVPHAAPGGKTWTTVEAALTRGQLVCTLEDDENTSLTQQGARAVDVQHLIELVTLQTNEGNEI